jgi:hypothetical protein
LRSTNKEQEKFKSTVKQKNINGTAAIIKQGTELSKNLMTSPMTGNSSSPQVKLSENSSQLLIEAMDLTYILLLPLIVLLDCCTLGATAVLLIALDKLVRRSPKDIQTHAEQLKSIASTRCRRDLRLAGANSIGASMPLFAPPSVARKPLLPAEVNAVKRKILVTGATGYIGEPKGVCRRADKACSDSCCAGLAAADSFLTSLLPLLYR